MMPPVEPLGPLKTPSLHLPQLPHLPQPPQMRTSFVGREHDLETARRILKEGARLLTLIGPPGVGKTRLVMELAAQRHSQTIGAEGVVFVPLAAVRKAALVPQAVARALGMADAGAQGGQQLIPAIKEHIGRRGLLLILDNMEHVLAAALLVDDLLTACSHLTVLATSRTALALSGERELPLAPLAVPPAPPFSSVSDVSNAAAAQLFVQRAQAVRPGFVLDGGNAAAVAAICRRLDGLPLAIELAAARMRLLSTDALLEQLNRRLPLLAGGPRNAPARQQTLESAIAWSYDLLPAGDRRLFRRLGVFSGGCTPDAVAAVCFDETAERGETAVLDRLESLSKQSLLYADPEAGAVPRLGMLELIRDYAIDRLAAEDDADTIRWRHARYYGALAEQGEGQLKTAAQPAWVERLEREHANLRAALTWLLACAREGDSTAVVEGLRLAGSLWWFWHLRAHTYEGREWLHAFLALPTPQAALVWRARALFAAGFLAWSCRFLAWDPADQAAAVQTQEESLALFRSLGDRHGAAYALWGRGLTEYGVDQARQARLLRESLTLFREVGDRWGIVKALEHLGNVASNTGQPGEARRLYEEGLIVARDLGEPQGLAGLLRQLGNHALYAEKDLPAARAYFGESADALADTGLLSPVSLTHLAFGRLALAEGGAKQAVAHFQDAFHGAFRRGSRQHSAEAIMGLASVAAAAGQWECALRLAGAAVTFWLPAKARGTLPAAAAVAKFATGLERHARWLPAAREATGEARGRELLAEGARRPPHETVFAAVAVLTGTRHPRVPRAALGVTEPSATSEQRERPGLPPPTPLGETAPATVTIALTTRERETAALIARGLTNREIAAALTITERTVMRHVEHILAKLGLRSRTQIAVWVVEQRTA